MELFALPLGDCCCPYETIAPGVRDGMRAHIPVAGYLIRLADDKLALVDTGMSRLHIDDPEATWRGTPAAASLVPVMRPEDSLLFRLAQLGIAPQEIDYVINTHLHFDHAGNNDLLGRATFFVQREQYELAKGDPRFPNQYWNLPALSYELVDGEQELFPGLRVLPTPGHTPGHQSVLLRLPETGAVIICGDAVNCQDNYDHDSWSGQADPATARESAHRLLAVAKAENGTMFYGHDREQARQRRWAPGASYR
ncbi:MAG TPA: N-acyl homoserine lactonase family protein [Pseudonocardiaceae bacterium]|jgi:N-acyl homoserine lactone hydrolase|nr:N-acyl homoserine lactonase family protein [Pseudonocardiaceae bacterium]